MRMTQSRVPRSQGRAPEQEEGRSRTVVVVRRVFGGETGNYFLLLGTTLFLVLFGLVMVLSSSSVTAISRDQDFFILFIRQALFALIGLPIMLLASRMPVSFWKRWARLALLGSIVLQLLVFVPGLGYASGGNQNWIRIGEFSAQPSELVKVGLALWIPWVLTAKAHLLSQWKHVLAPVGPVAIVAVGLVLAGRDLGTAAIMLMIVVGCFFYAGVRLRIIGVLLAAMALVGFIFAVTNSNRMDRIEAWQRGCTDQADFMDECWQTVHGWWALASGGIFGTGLGGSRAKWNWLPAADNDFIFAIIGDELGLIGALVVLLLFVILTIAFVRIAGSSRDPFARNVTAAVMIWIIGQAFVNIGVVLGLLPVLGVPLPLISAGGSALVSSLLAIGIVLSFARYRERTT